jgi:hypothetical protein
LYQEDLGVGPKRDGEEFGDGIGWGQE